MSVPFTPLAIHHPQVILPLNLNNTTNSIEQSPSWEAYSWSASQRLFPYGKWRFITVFTRGSNHWYWSWASWIQWTPSQLISLIYIFNIIFPSMSRYSKWAYRIRFSDQIFYPFLIFPIKWRQSKKCDKITWELIMRQPVHIWAETCWHPGWGIDKLLRSSFKLHVEQTTCNTKIKLGPIAFCLKWLV